jgi:chromosome partitioning protein
MLKFALVNQKGGVGKTTSAVNLSSCLSRLGKRVLLIDIDPQANATLGLGISGETSAITVYDILKKEKKYSEAIKKVSDSLDIIPSNIELAAAELDLQNSIARECVLKDALQGVDSYDITILDCPPSLGLLNINALVYVDYVLIPIQCEFFALQGVTMLMKTIDLVRSRINPRLEIGGIIACMYNVRTSLSSEVYQEIKNFFREKVFETRIRTNVRLAEAPSHGKSIVEYAPDSHGAEDYFNLAREILGRFEVRLSGQTALSNSQ